MSRKSKIFIAVVILFVALFLALSIIVSIFGKDLAEHKLREFFRAKTSISSLSLSIPLTINIRGLQIGQLFRADNISFSPSILSLFAGRVILNNVRIINPLLNIEMDAEGRLNLTGPPPAAGAKKGKSVPLLLTALSIKNGKVIFSDKKIMPQGYQTIIERVNIDISKTMLPPTSLNIKFRLQGQLADSKEQPLGAIYGSGWIDFGPKDMDGALEIKEVELTHFSPYYGNFISSRKLLSAKLSSLSGFKAKNNALKITTELKLHDLVYAQQDSEKINPTSIFELAQNALDLFLDPSGNLNLQFTIDTRLDKPQVTITDLKGLILQAAIQNLSSQSPVELIKKGKQLLEQFKDFGKGLEDLF